MLGNYTLIFSTQIYINVIQIYYIRIVFSFRGGSLTVSDLAFESQSFADAQKPIYTYTLSRSPFFFASDKARVCLKYVKIYNVQFVQRVNNTQTRQIYWSPVTHAIFFKARLTEIQQIVLSHFFIGQVSLSPLVLRSKRNDA